MLGTQVGRRTGARLFIGVFALLAVSAALTAMAPIASATTAQANLSVTLQTAPPNPVIVNQTFNYLLKVTNGGPDAVSNVHLTETMAANFTVVQGQGVNASSSCNFGSTITCNDGVVFCSTPSPTPAVNAVISCTTSSLASGASVFIRVSGRPTHSGTIVDTATVTGDDLNDSSPTDNTLDTTVNVAPTAELALDASVPGSVATGSAFDLTLSVTNHGPDTATAITTSTTIPANVSFVSGTGCTGTTTVTCTISSLAKDAVGTATLHLSATADGDAHLNSTVTATQADSNTANNTANRTVTISPTVQPPGADLDVAVSGPSTGKAGGSFTYTITLVNKGPDPATATSLVVDLPSQAGSVFPVANGSLCTGGTVSSRVCSLGTLNNLDSRTITVTGNYTGAGTASLTATASSATTDGVSSNNSANVSTTVARAQADLVLATQTAPPDPASVGSLLTYTLKVTNLGPDPVGSLTLTDTIAANLSGAQAGGLNSSSTSCNFGSTITCTDGVVFCSTPSPTPVVAGVATCTDPVLAPGATIFVRFSGSPAHGGPVVDTATVTGADFDDPTPLNNTLDTTINVPPDPPVTFTPPASGTYGGSATLSATAGTATVTFAVAPTSDPGVCTVAGTTVSYTGVGSCVVRAAASGHTATDGTITVGPAPVTITADDKTMTYGGTEPTYTFQVSGLLGGNQLITPPTCAPTGPHAAAGPHPIACSGADAGPHYAIRYVDGTLTVNATAVTVTADDKTMTYGDPEPTYTFSRTGLLNGEALTQDPTCGVTGDHVAVGTYPITCSGADAGPNHTVEYAAGTLTVGRRGATVTAPSPTMTYGDPLPALIPSYGGLATGDTAPATPAMCTTAATSASAVGTYAVTCSGAADPNYTFGYVGGTLTIGRARITVTADDKTRVAGTSNPPFTVTFSAVRGNDTPAGLSAAVTCSTTATATSPAGTYPITCTGTLANYTPTFVPGALTVTAPATGSSVKVCTMVKTDWRAPYKDGTCPADYASHDVATTATGGVPVCIMVKTDWRAPYKDGTCPADYALVHVVTTPNPGLPVCIVVKTDWRAPYKDGTCPADYAQVQIQVAAAPRSSVF